MKIGVYFDSAKSLGGAHSQNLRLIEIFNQYFSNKYEINYIVSNLDQKTLLEKKGEKVLYLKKNFWFKIEQFLFRFSFFKEIYKKFSLNNKFENELIKNKFDLIFFNSPVEQVLLINKLNFVVMLLSMQHVTTPILPEYKTGHDIEIRNDIINHSVKKSFKIFVGAEKDKDFLIKYFNSDAKKIIVQSYLFTLPYIYEFNKDLDYNDIYQKLNLPNKDIIFYPAQFWAHKNHKYILDIAIHLKKKRINENIFFVFTGFDKGNLSYIKQLIKKNDINDYVKIFDYIDDYQLISLYKNAYGVLMPTLIGHTTIPMYESFYFKKNIFYTEGLSDENLKKYLTEIDINEVESFLEKFRFTKSNNEQNNNKLDEAKTFFDSHCNEKKIVENFSNAFNEFRKLRSMWF